MRAAVVYEHGPLDRIVLEDNYGNPEAKEGWVRLRVRACSLNYHDIFSRRGMDGIELKLPLIIGSDIAGRDDDMFVCNGENIFPGEVERLLQKDSRIVEAFIVPLDDEVRGQIPVAFIVRSPQAVALIG